MANCRNCRYGSKGASEIIFKNEIKAEDPAAKLLEKKQNMLSCSSILQPQEVLSMSYLPSRLAEN
jgi:hypothetical protein